MRNMDHLRSKRQVSVTDAVTSADNGTGRSCADESVDTSPAVSIRFCNMKHFPMRTETDQLALGISDVMEQLVNTVASTNPDWADVIARFERIISLHKHSGILRGRTAATMILWNAGFLLVRKLEASTADPALWSQAVKPLESLSEQMGIDLHKEFASLEPKAGE